VTVPTRDMEAARKAESDMTMEKGKLPGGYEQEFGLFSLGSGRPAD
jgi:hypothetical protein